MVDGFVSLQVHYLNFSGHVSIYVPALLVGIAQNVVALVHDVFSTTRAISSYGRKRLKKVW